jgi:type IV pilus assembly protein PilA
MKVCPSCSNAIAESDLVCPFCNNPLLSPGGPQAGVPATTSPKAIASLVLGIFALFPPAAILAVLFGHLARSDVRRSQGRLKGSGMALAGLIFGYLGSSTIPILIIAAIAIPNLERSRMLADEASAVGSLRTMYAASTAYSSSYGNGFPPSLAALGPATDAGHSPDCDHAELIDRLLAGGRKSGYIYSYLGTTPLATPAHGCGSPGYRGFMISADPINRGSTGQRSFLLDSSGTIRYNTRNAATPADPVLR